MGDVISGASELTPDAVLGILDEPGEASPSGDVKPVESAEQPVEQPVEKPAEQPVEERRPEEQPAEERVEKPAEKPAEPKPEGEFDDEVGAPRVVEYEGKKEWHWPESRAKTIYAGYEEAKKYREIAPTLQEAGVHRDAYVDQLAMHSHLRSGDPEKIQHFVNYWNRQAPKSMGVLTTRMVEAARTSNPEVYQSVVAGSLRDVADQFYREYAATPNKEASEEAAKLLFAAQMLDWYLGSEFKPSDAVKPVDPVAERLAEVERREAEVEKFHAERAQSAWNNFSAAVNANIRSGVQADIDDALKPIENLKKDQPLVYKAAASELREAVRAAIEADKSWGTLYGLKHEDAKRTMSDKDRKELVTMYRLRARRAISAVRSKVLSSVGSSVVSQSEQEHKRLEEASRRKETKGGAPSPQKVRTDDLQGKTLDEKVKAILEL